MGCVLRAPVEVDELVERWTVLEDEQQLVAGKRGATRLGFALLLKFYTRSGRFPRGRSELPQEAVDFVARQMQVAAGDLHFYEWSGTGSTIEYHRAQIRQHLGYRECGVADAERLTAWLAEHVEPHPVDVDELDYHGSRGSNSRAKKLEAANRISLARLSSRTSRSRSLTLLASAVLVPGRRPASMSPCLHRDDALFAPPPQRVRIDPTLGTIRNTACSTTTTDPLTWPPRRAAAHAHATPADTSWCWRDPTLS